MRMSESNCTDLWSVKRGIELVLDRKDVESATVALHKHFVKHAWYLPDAFEDIWAKMQEVMPMALEVDEGGTAYPLADMLLATSLGGYPRRFAASLSFGIFVTLTLASLIESA
ncbi:MAG: hypothetical protein U0746_21695 [Gemmataceae bacterium]